jgi:hypothetical protein
MTIIIGPTRFIVTYGVMVYAARSHTTNGPEDGLLFHAHP